jgi:hypothetical protein
VSAKDHQCPNCQTKVEREVVRGLEIFMQGLKVKINDREVVKINFDSIIIVVYVFKMFKINI